MKGLEQFQFGNVYLLNEKYNLEKILEEVSTLPDLSSENQVMLQGTEENSNYHLHSTDQYDYIDSDFSELLFDIPYINSIIKELNLYRTRIMGLKPKTCLTWHRDAFRRVHIPLISDWRCLFVVEDKAIHLPADGSAYYVDTNKFHTVFNGTFNITRLHLVGSILPQIGR
jgi:hypothetical protein